MPAPRDGGCRGFYAECITAKVMVIISEIVAPNAKDSRVIFVQERLKELFESEYVEVEDRKK